MTGLHMGHCRIRKNRSARGQDHLLASDQTIAEVLKQVGYATCVVGKWGVGLPDTEGTPDKKGFDLSYGFYDQKRAHTYYPHYLYENGRPVPIPENYGFDMERSYRHTHESDGLHEYDENGRLIAHGVKDPQIVKNSEELCYEKSLEFIDKNSEQPFFLYYATQLPHGPCITPNLGEFKDKPWSQKHKEWASMITHLDQHVGGIVERLKQHNILDNTIIFFASDNGYSHWGYMGRKKYADDPVFRNKGPWRGGKFISWEGGVRIPMFVTWPGYVSTGITYHVVALYDFFATACELAGIKQLPQTDGISFVPLLEGHEEKQVQHEFLYWENGGHAPHAQAVRIDKWFAWREHPSQPVQLWDTEMDVESEHDVASEYPDVVQRVLEIFETEHVESEWFLNPGDKDQEFKAKVQRAEQAGGMQEPVTANTQYRGILDNTISSQSDSVKVDSSIPD
jgi:arylsulfatase A-like enzyme